MENLKYNHINTLNNIIYKINCYEGRKIKGINYPLDLNKCLGYKNTLEIMSCFYTPGSNEFDEILKVYNKLLKFMRIYFNYDPIVTRQKFATYEDQCENPYNKFLTNKTKRLA